MPYTFPNPYNYTSPIGQALGNATQAMFNRPTAAQQTLVAEQALALKRQREGITSVADLFGNYGGPGFDRNTAMREAVLGGYDPQKLADLERYGSANTYGATDPRTDNASVGAGSAYASTAGGFNATLAETTRNNNQQSLDRRYGTDVSAGTDLFRFNNTPKEATVNGVPQYVPQSGAFAPGVRPILPETNEKGLIVANNWDNLNKLDLNQQRYVFGNPSYPTISNYLAPDGTMHVTYDGRTDAQTGAPLAPGGSTIGQNNVNLVSPTVRSNLQGQTIANANLGATLNSVRDAVTSAPDVNFGATGFAKTVAQNATILATNIATGLGFSAPEDALAAVQKQAAAAGLSQDVLSGIFDPRLGAMETSYGLLIYQVAGALAGQQGRGISDADVKRAQSMVGDPTGLLSNKQTLLSKLDALQTQLNINQGTVNTFLGSPTLNGKPGAVVPSAPAVPQGALAPQPGIVNPRAPTASVPGPQSSAAPPAAAAQPIAAVTNQPTRAANAQGYGDHLTGTITVNGHTYQWGSGGGGRGSIPFGTYDVKDFMTGAQRTAAGYEFKRDSFMLSDANDPLIPGQAPRTGLLLHSSDAGYTAGCIGIEGNFNSFIQDMQAEANQRGGLGGVKIQVGPTGAGAGASPAPAGAAAPSAPAAGGAMPSGPLPNGYTSVPSAQAPQQYGGAAPWTPAGKTAANGVQSPKGDIVPTSFLKAHNGDADLWDYLSAPAKESWKATHGD